MQRTVPVLRICLLLALACATSTPADEFPKSGRIIVTTADAEVRIAGQDARPVGVATVHSYSRVNGHWLWVDALWGWLESSDVVLLDNADEHYTNIIRASELADQPTGVARHQRGIARLALGKPREALADFDAAIADGYTIANVDINRANALAALDRSDDAIEALTQAIAKAPGNGFAFNARSLQLCTKEFFDAALADADRAVELLPREAQVWYTRGYVRQQVGQFEGAVGDYSKAVELSPRYARALANRAYCLKQARDFVKAKRDYKAALDIAPDLWTAHNDYAWLLATCRKTAIRDAVTAIRSAEMAVKATDRDNGLFLDTLAAAYAADGQWDRAVKTAAAAVEKLDGANQYAADQRLQLYRDKKRFVERD